MEKISVDFVKNMTYQAHVNQFDIIMDAAPEHGGENNGMSPKPLLLVSLAGCTGMDIASLAKKMRVEIKKLNIDVQAEKSEEVPVVYNSFHVIYNFEANDNDLDKIIKMVRGSQEKYCGVSTMLRKVAPITYVIYLNGVSVFEG